MRLYRDKLNRLLDIRVLGCTGVRIYAADPDRLVSDQWRCSGSYPIPKASKLRNENSNRPELANIGLAARDADEKAWLLHASSCRGIAIMYADFVFQIKSSASIWRSRSAYQQNSEDGMNCV